MLYNCNQLKPPSEILPRSAERACSVMRIGTLVAAEPLDGIEAQCYGHELTQHLANFNA